MSVKTNHKTKLVPVNRSVALLPERDANISPILECIDLGVTFGGLKAVDNFRYHHRPHRDRRPYRSRTAPARPRFSICSPRSIKPTRGTILAGRQGYPRHGTARSRSITCRYCPHLPEYPPVSATDRGGQRYRLACSNQMKYSMASGIFRLPALLEGRAHCSRACAWNC